MAKPPKHHDQAPENATQKLESDEVAYARLKQTLTEWIEEGILGPGYTLASENELASEYGISRSRVRKALAELETEGYITRSQGKRSTVAAPSERGTGLTTTTSPTIAIAFPEYQNLFTRTIMDGFMRYCAENNVHTIVYSIRFGAQEEAAFFRQVRQSGVRGLAVWLQNDEPNTRQAIEALCDSGFPVVQIDRYLNGLAADYVVTDNETLGYTLTKRLLARGHRRLAFIQDLSDASSNRGRLAGFRRALKEAKVPCHDQLLGRVDPLLAPDSAQHGINEIMAHRERPTACVCNHDKTAQTVAHELQRLGYRVPEDMEIAAVDDEHHAQTLGMEMISISQDGQEMGRLAAELILARLNDPKRPAQQRLIKPLNNEPKVESFGSRRREKGIRRSAIA